MLLEKIKMARTIRKYLEKELTNQTQSEIIMMIQMIHQYQMILVEIMSGDLFSVMKKIWRKREN
jgi:hypothetical protein